MDWKCHFCYSALDYGAFVSKTDCSWRGVDCFRYYLDIAALTIGILGICIGDMTAFSWFELPAYASGLFMLSYTLIAVWALVVFSQRKEPFSFASQWFNGCIVVVSVDLHDSSVFYELFPSQRCDAINRSCMVC